MAFLVLDIETIPRPTIDKSVEEVITQKTQARVERTGDDPENAESLIRSTSPFFGQVLCIGSPKEGDVKGDTVAKASDEGNIEAVNEYVMRDVETTHHLFEKLRQYIN